MRREVARGKTDYRSWDAEALRRVLVQENPRIGPWLDTSNMTAEETAAHLIARAQEARISEEALSWET